MKVISYNQLVINEDGTQVQKGMNFAIKDTYSIVLMSTEKNSPYNDELLEDGIIEYEGHDAIKSKNYNRRTVYSHRHTNICQIYIRKQSFHIFN